MVIKMLFYMLDVEKELSRVEKWKKKFSMNSPSPSEREREKKMWHKRHKVFQFYYDCYKLILGWMSVYVGDRKINFHLMRMRHPLQKIRKRERKKSVAIVVRSITKISIKSHSKHATYDKEHKTF